jgi:hypothetical protein
MIDPVWEKNKEQLHMIAKAFYQAYRLTGTVKMKFGLRTIADSDGNSVVDVYVSPRDREAASTLVSEDSARHMQFLETMVPSTLLGYQFILAITPEGPEEIGMEPIDIIEPAMQAQAPSSGPGLAS